MWRHVFDTDGARSLTVVVDGVGDDGVKSSGVVAVLILQENLNAQANHVQVVFLCLQQLLPWHYDKTHLHQLDEADNKANIQKYKLRNIYTRLSL